MNWFGGSLLVTLVNGTSVRIYDVPFNEAAIKAALEARVRPQFVKELMYEPYSTTIEIPEEFRA